MRAAGCSLVEKEEDATAMEKRQKDFLNRPADVIDIAKFLAPTRIGM